MYLYWVKKQRLLDPALGEYISLSLIHILTLPTNSLV